MNVNPHGFERMSPEPTVVHMTLATTAAQQGAAIGAQFPLTWRCKGLQKLTGWTGAPDYPALNAYMLNSALKRSAIAPLWEVKTAKMQQEIGDPNAGVTEEERSVCYEISSRLRTVNKGRRWISCVTVQHESANQAYWREAA